MRISSYAGLDFSGQRTLRTDLPKQCANVEHGNPSDLGDYGELCRRRSLSSHHVGRIDHRKGNSIDLYVRALSCLSQIGRALFRDSVSDSVTADYIVGTASAVRWV